MTNYEKILKEMNAEKMANDRVKMVLINRGEPFYMTSRGQLYTFNNLREAVIDEYDWLIKETSEPLSKETELSDGVE